MTDDNNPNCSFCGKTKEVGNPFISGGNAYICKECVEESVKLLRSELILSNPSWLIELTIYGRADLLALHRDKDFNFGEFLKKLVESKPDSLLDLVMKLNDFLMEPLLKLRGEQYLKLSKREHELESELSFRRRRFNAARRELHKTDHELDLVAEERATVLEQFPQFETELVLPQPAPTT